MCSLVSLCFLLPPPTPTTCPPLPFPLLCVCFEIWVNYAICRSADKTRLRHASISRHGRAHVTGIELQGGAGARLARRRRLLSSPDAQQVALPRNYLSSSHGARCDAAANEQQAVRGGGGGGVRETETPPPPLDFGNQSFSH